MAGSRNSSLIDEGDDDGAAHGRLTTACEDEAGRVLMLSGAPVAEGNTAALAASCCCA